MTEDNNPSHENKGERSKDETENIKARERTNARKITTGVSFLLVVAPFLLNVLKWRRREAEAAPRVARTEEAPSSRRFGHGPVKTLCALQG